MFKQKRLTVLSLAVLLALLMAAVMPMSALAQDEAPPQPDVPVVEEPVVDEPAAEEPAVEEPAAEEPAAGEPVVEEPVAEEMTVPEILEAAPEGTEVVVLDEAGEALPLVSLEAAEALLTSDPMWCPAGVAAVTADCVNDATVAGLLTKIVDMTQAGVIYFMPTYTEDDAYFDGAALGTTADYAITFQGGWNGATTVGNAISFADDTEFSNPFHVVSWNADVTINDFTITGVNTGGKNALLVQTAENIVLNNVDVSGNNLEGGAFNAMVSGTDVTINNSRFDNNEDDVHPGQILGLLAGGKNVTLNQVSASYNDGTGAALHGSNVTVSDSTFNFNTSNETGVGFGHGLVAQAFDGDVTLNNVSASYNSMNGVNAYASENIYVNGGWFTYNGFSPYEGSGLYLKAGGSIVLNDVYTYGNRGLGAGVCAGEDVYISNSHFEGNWWGGINVECAKDVYTFRNYFWYNGYDPLNPYPDWYWPGLWLGHGWLGHYYGQFDQYWGGFYHAPFDSDWYDPHGEFITINGLFFNGNYMPNYNTYYYFFQDFYVHRISYSPLWWWVEGGGGSDWRYQWIYRYFGFAPVVTQTTPMSLSVTPLAEDDLPGDLPEGKTFADAFEAKVSGGIAGEVTEAFFEVPEGFAEGDTLTVLSWNGSAWEEVDAKIEDGKVTFMVGESGTFALVTP